MKTAPANVWIWIRLIIALNCLGTLSVLPVRCQERLLLCESEVAISDSIPNAFIHISEHRYHSNKSGHSWGVFYAQNSAEVSIRGFAAILEYRDQNGKIINRVPYIAVTEEGRKAFQSPIRGEEFFTLTTDLEPGQGVHVQSLSQIINSSCPVRGAVTFLFVQFSNGGTITWSSPEWKLDPILDEIPREHIHLPSYILIPSLDLLVKARINAEGRVQELVGSANYSTELLSLLREQLSSWTFFPALSNGKTAVGEIDLLIRFYAKNSKTSKVEIKDVPIPLSVVRLLPEQEESGRWRVWYGWRMGGTYAKRMDAPVSTAPLP